MDRKSHWDNVYLTKPEDQVSWYQSEPTLSLQLIREFCPAGGRVIDVGGGASVLVDRLLEAGFERPAVLDVSQAALERSKNRLGDDSQRVEWIVADNTTVQDLGSFDVWHDRAAFHFLTDAADRRRYIELAARTLPTGGHAMLATFAPDGPTHCSGLEVCRHDGRSVSAELGERFAFVRELVETHVTPAGKPQQFYYGVFQRR